MSDDEVSYNTLFNQRLNKIRYHSKPELKPSEKPKEKNKKIYNTYNHVNPEQNEKNEETPPEEPKKPKPEKLIPALNEIYNRAIIREKEKQRELKEKEEKEKQERERKEKEEKEKSINSIFKYSYKHKYHADLKRIIFVKTRMKIPAPLGKSRNKTFEETEKEMIDILNNSINNINNNTGENEEKNYAYIKRFPTNRDYLVFVKDNFYIIFNVRTGEKIRTQKTNDAYGFQGIIPLPRERILAVGADFLRVYHYNLSKKELKFVEPNNTYPTYENILYVRQISSHHVVICKKTVCYLYNIDKCSSDRVIYLKSIIKLLNNKKSFKGIVKTDLDLNEDYFSNCKVFSKREFGLCYRSFIFLVSVPEGGIFTYIDVSNSTNIMDNSKKYIKRMNIFLNMNQDMKKFYLIWPEGANSIKIYVNQEQRIHKKRERFVIPPSNNTGQEISEKHNLLIINSKEEMISYVRNIFLGVEQRVYNVKQCSNYEVIIITKDNDMLIFNFVCNTFITTIKYARIILDKELYFLKRIGKDLFLTNLRNGMLGLVGMKTGKILKKFNIDCRFIICADVNVIPRDEDGEIKYHKHILILNSFDIFSLEI